VCVSEFEVTQLVVVVPRRMPKTQDPQSGRLYDGHHKRPESGIASDFATLLFEVLEVRATVAPR
jgi:hypothetical protein